MSPELLLPAAFFAGFFGSSHCIGMCGAVVVLLESQLTARDGRWSRRVLYNLGRLGFYAMLGAIAGLGGALITQTAGIDVGLVLLRVAAGLLVIALGLNLAFGWQSLAPLEQSGAKLWKMLSPLTRRVLPVSTAGRALGAGLMWGALPCGLVYGAAGLAAASGDPAGGALVMLVFWLGTLPALLLAGASAARLQVWRRRGPLRRSAGLLLIMLGLVAIGLPLMHFAGDTAHLH